MRERRNRGPSGIILLRLCVRMFALVLILNAPLLWPQAALPPVAAAPDAQAAITGALLGRWTGVLEYRDLQRARNFLKTCGTSNLVGR